MYDCIKTWRKKGEMMTTGMVLKKEPQEFLCYCINAWSGETGQTHIEFVGFKGDDAPSAKHSLDALEGHCMPRGNEIIVAAAYKYLVQDDLDLAEYIEMWKEVTAACILSCLLQMSSEFNPPGSEKPKCIWEVHCCRGLYNLCRYDPYSNGSLQLRQLLSIMQRLSSATT